MSLFTTDATEKTTWQGKTIAAHFGDVEAEVEALRDARAFADLTGFGVVVVSGPDAADYLHRQITCAVKNLAEGESRPGAVLKGNGMMVATFDLHRSGDEEYTLICPPVCTQPLLEHLDRFCFGEKVTFESRPMGIVMLVDGESSHAKGVATEVFGVAAHLLLMSPDEIQDHCEDIMKHGLHPVGLDALNVVRIANGTPLFGEDHDETWIPNDAGLGHLINYEKGCFPGQEVVAKMQNVGHPRLALCRFEFSDGAKPETGMALFASSGQAGSLSSVVQAGDDPIALGHVKWKHREETKPFNLADREGSAGQAQMMATS